MARTRSRSRAATASRRAPNAPSACLRSAGEMPPGSEGCGSGRPFATWAATARKLWTSGSAGASWRRTSAPGSGPMGMERIHSATRPETERTASGWPSPPAQAAGMPTRAAILAGGAFSGPSRRSVAWMAPSSSPAVRASSSVVMSAWTIIGIGAVRSFNDGRSLAAQGFSGGLYLALDGRDGGVVFFEQLVGALQVQLGQARASGIWPHGGAHELVGAIFLRQCVGEAAHGGRYIAEQ